MVNYLENLEAYNRELFRAYKRIFSGLIKESFLIEMIKKVEGDYRYGAIFLQNNNPNSLFSIDKMLLGKSFNSTNVCKMIVMTHYFNAVMLTDYERGKKQESNQYKDKLVDDVLKMLKVEKIATFDFSNFSLEAYLPLVYYVSALCNDLANKYEELNEQKKPVKTPFNNGFNYQMMYKLIMKIKACVNLADIRATDELIILFRSLIELFMTYAALWDESEPVINSFYNFDKAAFDYNYSGKIPGNIEFLANNFGVNKVQFVNYGWIKNLREFKDLTKISHAFTLGGLAKMLDKKYKSISPNFVSDLHKLYKLCNPQTHGTILAMNYFQLELHIFQNIALMLIFISDICTNHLFDVEFIHQDIDLINELKIVRNESTKISDWMANNDANLKKTNIDYCNRAISIIKMKQ